MIIATSIVLIVTSLLMVVLVLMHKGKGGGLSDMFGGGVSSSLGGSSVVERNLDRLTVGVGVLWFASIVVLGLLSDICDRRRRPRRSRTAAEHRARSIPWVVATRFGAAASGPVRWERRSAATPPPVSG